MCAAFCWGNYVHSLLENQRELGGQQENNILARVLWRMLYGINYCGQARAAAIPPVVGRVGQVKTISVCILGGRGKL